MINKNLNNLADKEKKIFVKLLKSNNVLKTVEGLFSESFKAGFIQGFELSKKYQNSKKN